MRITLKKTEKFHRQKHKIGKIIVSRTDKHETVYGARALNVRFPTFLDRHTRDFDIFSSTPRKDAVETEKALDKEFGGDFFYVKKGEYPSTYKVKAHATDETYADYTKTPKDLERERIRNLFFPTIPHIEKSLKRTLADPEAEHRHKKDQDSLNRIQIFKKLRRR